METQTGCNWLISKVEPSHGILYRGSIMAHITVQKRSKSFGSHQGEWAKPAVKSQQVIKVTVKSPACSLGTGLCYRPFYESSLCLNS